MNEKFKIDIGKDIIEVLLYGQMQKREIILGVYEVDEIMQKNGIKKVFIDTTRLISLPNAFDLYEIFSHQSLGIWFAILMKKTQKTAADIIFIKTVAENRWANVKIFEIKQKAVEWLKSV